MNFNDLLGKKTQLPNLRLSEQARAKVLLKPEFDTEDQVLLSVLFIENYSQQEKKCVM